MTYIIYIYIYIYIYVSHPFLLSITTSQSLTTLGFTINSHLDYSDHIFIMIHNANYFLYNIRKSRNKLTFSMTKSLIHSLVFSRLIYCCSLLCNLPLKLMLKLEKIQRRAIRTLYKLKLSSIVSISTLMRSLGWLKFRYLCRYRLLCITHKVIHLRSPEYLADLISIQTLSRASRKCHTMKIMQRSTLRRDFVVNKPFEKNKYIYIYIIYYIFYNHYILYLLDKM